MTDKIYPAKFRFIYITGVFKWFSYQRTIPILFIWLDY